MACSRSSVCWERVRLDLLLVGRHARPRQFEILQPALLGRGLHRHFLQGDLGRPVSGYHRLALPAGLGDLRFDPAHLDVGDLIVVENGNDFVALDRLTVLDAQFGEDGAANRIAGDDRSPGGRIGVSA